MVKARKEKDDGGPSSQEQASVSESKRLQEMAVSRGLLSRFKANPAEPLRPTKTIHKCDGKDIVKKGNRKTKYLFAFPGLMAPIAGGKFGELTHLDSRNPTFYIDFPQGRLKLFGTIIYPKNKYLTMHFVPGRGDIVCEDCFESIVVFPEAWWIGTKEENPAELRLEMPSNLQQEKHADVDFTAGAGRSAISNAATKITKDPNLKNDPQSPVHLSPLERLQESQSSLEIAVEGVPLRRSSRKSIEKLNYADLSSYTSSVESERDSDYASDSSDSMASYTVSSSSDSEGRTDFASSDSSDYKRKGRRHRNTDADVMQSQPDATIEDKLADAATEQMPTVQTTDKKEIGTSFMSIGAEKVLGVNASSAILKQATLTSFLNTRAEKEPNVSAASGILKQVSLSSCLTKTDSLQASKVEIIEIEESPQKAGSEGTGGISDRPRRSHKRIFEEESEDASSSQGDGQSSSDSDMKKNVGKKGRGRGRGRGRGGQNAATSGGRTGTPRKGDAKRRQSITEISSSDEDDRPKSDHTRSFDSL